MVHLIFVFHLLSFVSIGICLRETPCPTLDNFLDRSPYLAQFKAHSYEGVWFELAFYDYTQFPKACGCTHLHWRLSPSNNSLYLDDFITSCPYEPVSIRKNYTIHMNGTADDKRYPFFIPETGFDLQFNNTVVYFRRGSQSNDTYDRAIQYQCKTDQSGKRLFTGVNFLSRDHFESDAERRQVISEMIDAATQAGVEQVYLKELKTVQWDTC